MASTAFCSLEAAPQARRRQVEGSGTRPLDGGCIKELVGLATLPPVRTQGDASVLGLRSASRLHFWKAHLFSSQILFLRHSLHCLPLELFYKYFGPSVGHLWLQ